MIVANHTPFRAITFESLNPGGELGVVCVVKATYRMSSVCELAPEQEDLVWSDQYTGEPGHSSLTAANDIAPFKPFTDIIFTSPVARSPNGAPERRWAVEVSLGTIRKRLVVTGPRRWFRSLLGAWSLSEPEPCLEVPITYEKAFGGAGETDGLPHQYNPVGCGFRPPQTRRKCSEFPAPQIESDVNKILSPSAETAPEGLGPIPPSWLWRRSKAGTYDETWKETRWPLAPVDFDAAFYNAAHPDLIARTPLSGGEVLRVAGLAPRNIELRLPDLSSIPLVFEYGSGRPARMMAVCDTITVNMSSMVLSVVWRGSGVPRDEPQQLNVIRRGEVQ